MSHLFRVVAMGSVLCGVWILAATASRAADEPPAAKPQVEPPRAASAETPAEKSVENPAKELSPAMTALRDRVRRTLAAVRQHSFNTRENTVADILHYCLAFGCTAEVQDGNRAGQKINGITCLCWNLPCGGYEPLMFHEGHLSARVGFGYQELPSQLAAVLALARVPADYPARAGENVRTVADLVEDEKLSCRAGTDQSLKLIALSVYAGDSPWKNSLGEEWSIERMVKQELDRPASTIPHAAVFRLLGLSCALERQAGRKAPLEGDWLRAKKYVEESHEQVLGVQNSDGSWGRSTSRDSAAALSATGHVLEWLAISLPTERLEDPRVVKAVEYVDAALGSQRYRWNVQSLSSRDIGSVMHAAHALVVYDQRVFQRTAPPAVEKPEKPAAEKPQKVANRSAK